MYTPNEQQRAACIELVDAIHARMVAREPIDFRSIGNEDYFIYLSNLCHERHGYYLQFELTQDPPRTFSVLSDGPDS